MRWFLPRASTASTGPPETRPRRRTGGSTTMPITFFILGSLHHIYAFSSVPLSALPLSEARFLSLGSPSSSSAFWLEIWTQG